MGLFDTERGTTGRDMFRRNLSGYDDLINAILGSRSEFEGINTTGDIGKKFGLSSDVSGVYAPQRRNLATSYAKRQKDIASSAGRSAQTQFASLPAQQDYFQSLNTLGSQEAQATLGQQDKIAQLLERILGNREGFGERRRGATGGALSARQGATEDYVNTLSDSSFFDDLLAGLGGGADLLGSGLLDLLKGSPKTKKTNENMGTKVESDYNPLFT